MTDKMPDTVWVSSENTTPPMMVATHKYYTGEETSYTRTDIHESELIRINVLREANTRFANENERLREALVLARTAIKAAQAQTPHTGQLNDMAHYSYDTALIAIDAALEEK